MGLKSDVATQILTLIWWRCGRSTDGLRCRKQCHRYRCHARYQGLGLRCPDDIALATVDVVQFNDLFEPSFTSAIQPIPNMAKAAATLLIDRLEGKTEDKPPQIAEFAPTHSLAAHLKIAGGPPWEQARTRLPLKYRRAMPADAICQICGLTVTQVLQ